ncbi:MAG: DUF6491 family protein [Allosphingosinicella sp.]|uniref:DUF6491 family protein n=1 Tax=Allosphingosinicella sp. TaxID=2823234 RepID=UPI0039229BB9
MMKKALLTLGAALVAAGGISAAGAAPARDAPREARIPFVNHGGIRDFVPAGRDVVYLQDRSRQWYRAELMGPCLGLPFARAIGVETWGASSFDRFGMLIVEGQRCPVQSLVRTERPSRA